MTSDPIEASLAFNSHFPSSESGRWVRSALPDATRDTVWHQYCIPETQGIVDWILLMSHAMLSSPEYRCRTPGAALDGGRPTI